MFSTGDLNFIVFSSEDFVLNRDVFVFNRRDVRVLSRRS